MDKDDVIEKLEKIKKYLEKIDEKENPKDLNSPLDGYWVIQDRMHPRWDRRIDFLVDSSITGGKWEDVKIEIVSDREIIHDWPYGRRNPYDDYWR